MATSSIFHNIVINDPDAAEAFVTALEASSADPYTPPDVSPEKVEENPETLRRIQTLRRANRRTH